MWPHSLNSVGFFQIKPKEEKTGLLFPLMSHTFDLVLHSRFKKMRSDVDRSTDQQIDRSTEKMTTGTLWHMRTDS